MAGRSLFVAGLQTAGVPGDPAATLDQFERNVRSLRATFSDLELVLAPELHLMALPPLLEEDGVSPHDLAVDVPGRADRAAGRARPRDGALARAGQRLRAGRRLRREHGRRPVTGRRARRELPQVLPLAAVRDDPAGHTDRLLRHRGHRPLRARDLPRRRVPRDLPLARVARRRGDLPGHADRHVRSRRRDGDRARERDRQSGRRSERQRGGAGRQRPQPGDRSGRGGSLRGRRRRGGRDGRARPRPGAARP